METKKKPKRRRFRFSLRIFCLFVLLCGTVLGYWSARVRPLQKQWRDAQPIMELDGVVFETVPADLPDWILALLPEDERGYIESLKIYDFVGGKPSKEVIEAISKLPRLKKLKLDSGQVDDDDCDLLSSAKALEHIEIGRNRDVTDRGIEALLKLPNLKLLDAYGTQATWRSHLLRQKLGLPKDLLQTNYDGFAEVDTNKDLSHIAALESPPFRGISIEASLVDIQALKRISSIKEIRLGMSSPPFSEELETLETLSDWEQLSTLAVTEGKESKPQLCSVKLFNKLSQLVANRTKSVSIRGSDPYEFRFQIKNEGTEEIKTLELKGVDESLFLSSLLAPMTNVEFVTLDCRKENATIMLDAFPNTRSLVLRPNYPGLGDQSGKHLARLERLEELQIVAQSQFQSLHWEFFEGWKSKDSLRKIHFQSEKIWALPSLSPLLEFEKLESVAFLTGDDEPIFSVEELRAAAAIEKPYPKAPKEGRFPWMFSKLVGGAKSKAAPKKSEE